MNFTLRKEIKALPLGVIVKSELSTDSKSLLPISDLSCFMTIFKPLWKLSYEFFPVCVSVSVDELCVYLWNDFAVYLLNVIEGIIWERNAILSRKLNRPFLSIKLLAPIAPSWQISLLMTNNWILSTFLPDFRVLFSISVFDIFIKGYKIKGIKRLHNLWLQLPISLGSKS